MTAPPEPSPQQSAHADRLGTSLDAPHNTAVLAQTH